MTDAPARPHWLPLLVVGVIGGVLSGAFGVGGGIVMVPLLIWLTGMDQRTASATSLAAILPSVVVGSIGYLLRGQVDLGAAIALAVGAVPGALIGTWLLRRINIGLLRWLFIALMVVIAVRMVLIPVERGERIEETWWVLALLFVVGVVTGIASGLFGVGGGVIMVPVLVVGFGVGDLVAKGTSLVAMIASSAVGTTSNLRARAVDLRSALFVGIAATLCSYLGVLLAFVMTPQVSSILFAALLLLSAGQLSVRTIRRGRADRRARAADAAAEPA
ncbi:sulfite exporter TauE/SafE family protein [Amnibacterium flavum]|uniref:Probable membrane transporter protein n=1 Tax=Amnibacterium flavum TaxID=2173173 RepID=A0A2V1HTM0_9MICO|nr:sulfite exporter TauE/SafE family protein [Amnibacterium flavum]PVZ93444.1 sulfite exporter TauE/SafE family protein [Amnibacterium flavum]